MAPNPGRTAVARRSDYAAANPGLNPFTRAEATPSAQAAVPAGDCPLGGCCNGIDKSRIVAAVNAHNARVYPPMQDPVSFNLDAVKKQIDEMIRNRHGR